MIQISITNIVALNGGDAAILLGMVKALKKRFGVDTRIVVFATYPETCKNLYPQIEWRETIGLNAERTPFDNIPILCRIARNLKKKWYYFVTSLYGKGFKITAKLLDGETSKSLRIYGESDYIISTGGTYLIEPYGMNSQYCDYRISLNLGRPLIFYTQSMGPFFKKKSRRRFKDIFSNSKVVFFRDERSKEHLLELKLEKLPKLYVVPDAAFALGNIDTIMQRGQSKIGDFKKVAISVRHWSSFHSHSASDVMNAYRKSIADTIVTLVNLKYEVHFISTCQGVDKYDDDNKEVEEILKYVPTEYLVHIKTYNYYLSIDALHKILNEVDFIISTRLHMCILSLIIGVPVFPIAYEFKTVELFEKLGYDNVLEMESLMYESLKDNVTEFIEEYDKSRSFVNKQIISYVKESIDVPNFII